MPQTNLGSVALVFDPVRILRGAMNRLSVEGVALRLDDVPPADIADIHKDAGTTLDEYLWQRYSPTQLAGSEWVYQRYVDVATYLLDERRNNTPGPGTTAAFKRCLDKLEKVLKGTLQIPNLAPRKSEAPVLVSPRTVLFPFPIPAVERSLSTGKADGYRQYLDPLDDGADYTI